MISPSMEKLGVISYAFDHYTNNKGILHVPFRYSPNKTAGLKNGFQIQYETICPGEERGHHYHTPENGHEEFCVLEGRPILIVQDIQSQELGLIQLEPFRTYLVPAGLAHAVANLSRFGGASTSVTMLIAKHFDYSSIPGTMPYKIDYSGLYSAIEKLARHE